MGVMISIKYRGTSIDTDLNDAETVIVMVKVHQYIQPSNFVNCDISIFGYTANLMSGIYYLKSRLRSFASKLKF